MKAYLVIQSDSSRIFGAGKTAKEAQKDALEWTDSLDGTRTIQANVEAESLADIDADTRFTEL